MANETISDKARVDNKGKQEPGIYGKTIAALRILVDGEVQERKIPAREGKPDRTFYDQRAIIVGGPTEVAFTMTAFEHSETLIGGSYMFRNDCIELDQYGSPTFKKWGDKYVRVGELTEAQMAKFAPTETSLDDLR
jgi:hypothetical protein